MDREPLSNFALQMRSYRAVIHAYFGNKCQRCSSTRRLHLHHLDGNPSNYRLENLTLLCSLCHGNEHRKRPYLKWIKQEPIKAHFIVIMDRPGRVSARQFYRDLERAIKDGCRVNRIQQSAYEVEDEASLNFLVELGRLHEFEVRAFRVKK